MPDIALVTFSGLPDLDVDDRCLVPALAARGYRATAVVWDDPAIDWSRFAAVVVRSTWDYFHRYPEFLAWIDRVSPLTRVMNPPRVLRWNSDKSYLRELEGKGIPIVPTLWAAKGSALDLTAVLREHGSIVVKPTVSAGAYRVAIFRAGEETEAATFLESITRHDDAMVQPFVRSLGDYGEHSLLFFGGELSHAVHRRPGIGVAPPPAPAPIAKAIVPDERERALAEKILSVIDTPLLYARVDLARNDAGEPMLSELELIEPSLFMYTAPEAPARLVAAIERQAR